MSPIRHLPTHLLALAALSICPPALSAADQDPAPAALAPADQAAIDKAVTGNLAKTLKAYDTYLASLDDATAKALKDLEKLKTEAMKSGNLPLANAADAQEKILKSGGMTGIVAWNHLKQSNTDLLGNQNDIKTLIVGAWKVTTNIGMTTTATFTNDGTVTIPLGHGKYAIDAQKGTVAITWDDGHIDTITKIEQDHLTGAGANGLTFDFTRVK